MFRPTYFEIPVVDMPRAIACYERLFGVDFELALIDGNEMALFPPNDNGVNAALAKGDSYAPSEDGTRPYLQVPSIDDVLAAVVELGLEVMYPKTSIGELGFVAEFRDSEGNRLALSEPLPDVDA